MPGRCATFMTWRSAWSWTMSSIISREANTRPGTSIPPVFGISHAISWTCEREIPSNRTGASFPPVRGRRRADADRGRREAGHTSRTNRAGNPDGPPSTVKGGVVHRLPADGEGNISTLHDSTRIPDKEPFEGKEKEGLPQDRQKPLLRIAGTGFEGPPPRGADLPPVGQGREEGLHGGGAQGREVGGADLRVTSRPGDGLRIPAGAPRRALSGAPPRRRTVRGPRSPFGFPCRTGERRHRGSCPSAVRRCRD